MGPVLQQRQHLACNSSSNLLAQHDIRRQHRRLPSHRTNAAGMSVRPNILYMLGGRPCSLSAMGGAQAK